MDGLTGPVALPVAVVAALLIGGGLTLWLVGRARRQARLPAGRIVYADTGDWRLAEEPLFSSRYRLAGKPDYLIETHDGIVPVEVKSGHTPGQPYDAHVLQLAAYCLLVEETAGQRRPRHGLIRYPAATFQVDYTPVLRDRLIEILADMRVDRQRPDVPRSHAEAQRCAGCGYRQVCGQSLD